MNKQEEWKDKLLTELHARYEYLYRRVREAKELGNTELANMLSSEMLGVYSTILITREFEA